MRFKSAVSSTFFDFIRFGNKAILSRVCAICERIFLLLKKINANKRGRLKYKPYGTGHLAPLYLLQCSP